MLSSWSKVHTGVINHNFSCDYGFLLALASNCQRQTFWNFLILYLDQNGKFLNIYIGLYFKEYLNAIYFKARVYWRNWGSRLIFWACGNCGIFSSHILLQLSSDTRFFLFAALGTRLAAFVILYKQLLAFQSWEHPYVLVHIDTHAKKPNPTALHSCIHQHLLQMPSSLVFPGLGLSSTTNSRWSWWTLLHVCELYPSC